MENEKISITIDEAAKLLGGRKKYNVRICQNGRFSSDSTKKENSY